MDFKGRASLLSWGSATIKLTKIYKAEEINKSLQKQNKAVLLKQINEVEGQIINIVTAITNRFVQEEFKAKMDELKNRKSELEAKLLEDC